ncbi:hypothetical protein PRIPAC_91120 [Pristionchus pacificus]|uniref:Uncharacterized protein n=1 Tax=Pristionchus pacificus TaxID=54126 RepID=A0A2A6CYS5_PRIPA|nr:hypothetical protein PRIPAC_91120 [Pristionchus pacificus]|eukprot:PDM83362.1 hypothetical protein PRIPAC_34994 [Pristionchus pacificus]
MTQSPSSVPRNEWHGFGCTCKSCRYPRRQGPQPGGGTHQRPQQNLTLDGATLASLANLQGGQCALSRQITNLSNLVSQMMERIENNPPLASSQLVAITSPAGPQSHIAPIPYPAAVTYQAAPRPFTIRPRLYLWHRPRWLTSCRRS